MSEKYRCAVDRITASEELKNKIMAAASERIEEKKKEKVKPKHTAVFYIKNITAYAACFVLCIGIAAVINKYSKGSMSVYVQQNNIVSKSEKTDDKKVEENKDNKDNKDNIGDNKDNLNPPGKNENGGAVISDNTAVKNNDTTKENKAKNGVYQQSGPDKEPEIKNETDIKAPEQSGFENENGGAGANAPASVPPKDDEDMVFMPSNPIEQIRDIGEAREKAGYDFKAPEYLPEGYGLEQISIIGESLIQITYENEEASITYRTQKIADENDICDISGDYNVYENEEEVLIKDEKVFLSGKSDLFFKATYTDGESAYSISSFEGLTKEEFIKIIESCK